MTDQLILRVGYSECDITPDRDIPLLGFEQRYQYALPGNDGVHDPLSARALAFDDGIHKPAVLIALDLAVIETRTARVLRKRIAEHVGTTEERIILACSHTHSGPYPLLPQTAEIDSADDAELSEDTTRTAFVEQGVRYYAELEPKLCAIAAQAVGLVYPMHISYQQAPAALGYNRRILDADGNIQHCWGPMEQTDLPLDPPDDTTVAVMALRQLNGMRQYMLFNIGVHADVLGKTSNVVSADWPGLARKKIDAMLADCKSLFLQGASGDVHPWIATQNDAGLLDAVATAAAGMVASLSYATRVQDTVPLTAASSTFLAGDVEVDITVWNLGGVALVALPVELFTGLSRRLRDASPVPVMLATVANGHLGYWPCEDDFQFGGYEIAIAEHMGLQAGDGERLMDAVLKLIEVVIQE